MSDTKAQSKGWLDQLRQVLGQNRFEDLLSTTGVLIVLGIVVLVNLIFGALPMRFDFTEHKIFTLSEGTKQILRGLDTPVTIRYYATDGADAMGADERQFSKMVEDRLIEYKKIGGGKIIFEKLVPVPDTNAEDSAEVDGVQPLQGQRGQVYMGIVVQCIDKKEVIPFVDPQREQLLEYDVTNAITRVYREDKPKVKIMTGLNIAGGFSGNFQAPPAEPWVVYRQLSRDFTVEVIPSTTEKIDPATTQVLIVLHPYDVTEVGEFAIDQYLMAGGTVIALVDPLFYAARMMTPPQNPMMGGMPPQGPAPSSDLPTLFGAYGVKYQAAQVVADTNYQTQIDRSRFLPTFLTLGREAFNPKNVVTAELNDVGMPFPGGFTIEEPVGVEVEPLVTSSKNNKLVASFEAEPEGLDRMMAEFRPTGKPLLLAARMSGRFKSAFPNGNPKPTPDPAAAGTETAPAPPVPATPPVSTPPPVPAAPPVAPAAPKEAPAPTPSAAPTAPVTTPPVPAPAPAAPKPAPAPVAPPQPEPAKPAVPQPAVPQPAEAPKPDTGGEKDGDAAKATAEKPKGDASLKETEKGKSSNLILVGDVDFLMDAFAVEIMNLGPIRQAVPRNQNLSLIQNLVENVAGDSRLISLRSRASTRRPFTLLNQMQAAAEGRMADKIKDLEAKEQEVGRKLQEALKVQEDGAIVLDQAAVDKGTIDQLREAQVTARREIRELRKELKRDKDSVVNMIKFLNIAVMPLVVIIAGLMLYGKRQNRMAAR
jgi:ABC-type uncharacterized transport system involved in gliding motility auxiliary subunit